MSGIPFIGSKISLISKSDIRYEGILHAIDTNESTVALENVQIFGTEGRGKPDKQILPSDQIYEYIVFRGSDIKDLHVKEAPITKTVPVQDPAIVSMPAAKPSTAPVAPAAPPAKKPEPIRPALAVPAKAAPVAAPVKQPIVPQKPVAAPAPAAFHAQTASAAAASKPSATAAQLVSSFKDLSIEKSEAALGNKKPARDFEERDQRSLYKQAQSQPPLQHQDQSPGPLSCLDDRPSRAQGGRSNYGPQNGGSYSHRSRRPQHQSFRDVTVPKSDFDMQSSNAKFDKEKLAEELPEAAAAAGASVYYDKSSSFFDNISCETKDADKDRKDFRTRTHEESKLNMETFGRTLNPHRGGHYRSGYRGSHQQQQHRGSGYGTSSYHGRGYAREPMGSLPQ